MSRCWRSRRKRCWPCWKPNAATPCTPPPRACRSTRSPRPCSLTNSAAGSRLAQQPEWGLADLTVPAQERVITALMLSGAAGEDQATTALRAVPDLADASAERLARIARWAMHLYPPGPVRIQPDMLAEWFLITQLTSVPGLASHLNDLAGHHAPALLTLLAHASDHMPAAVPLYARLIQADPAGRVTAGADAALTASTARPRLDAALAALVTSTHWPPGALAHLNRHLPQGALPRTRAAAAAATVDHTRETGTPEHLADALTSYGLSLTDLGRHREALAANEEALALYRDLAAANPAHQPHLANALNSYGTSLRDLGRHREALAAFQEALALYRDLAAANPAHQPALANALNSYGASLRDLGRHREALAACRGGAGPVPGPGRRQPRPPALPRQCAEQLRHQPAGPGTAPGGAGRLPGGAGPVPGPGRRQPRPPAPPRQCADQLRHQPAGPGTAPGRAGR